MNSPAAATVNTRPKHRSISSNSPAASRSCRKASTRWPQTLLDDGYKVMIETSGERFIGKLPEHVIKIVDVKCPDSGAPNTFEYRNLDALSHNDEVKFVISSRKDYEFAREFRSKHHLTARVRQVLFSPVFDDPEGKWKGLEPKQLVEWMLADELPVRLGLQLHKFVWHPSTKGV